MVSPNLNPVVQEPLPVSQIGPAEIAAQQELLASYRERLRFDLGQRILYSEADVPFVLVKQIASGRENIQRIKAILRGWNCPVADLPDDEEAARPAAPANAAPAAEPAAVTPPSAPAATTAPAEPAAAAAPPVPNTYIADAVAKLTAGGYEAKPKERFGSLRFPFLAQKKVDTFLRDFIHTVVFLEHSGTLSYEGFLALQDEMHEYANDCAIEVNADVLVLGVIRADNVDQELIDRIYDAEPPKPRCRFPNAYQLFLVVYSTAHADVFYYKDPPNDDPALFEDKIKAFLIP